MRYNENMNSMNIDRKNDIVEVFAGSPIEADIVSSMLSDANIKSFLKDEHMGSIAPWHVAAGGAGAVKIIINSENYAKAKAIIEEFRKNSD